MNKTDTAKIAMMKQRTEVEIFNAHTFKALLLAVVVGISLGSLQFGGQFDNDHPVNGIAVA